MKRSTLNINKDNLFRIFFLIVIIGSIIFSTESLQAQSNTTTLGIEYKPVIPSDLFASKLPVLRPGSGSFTMKPQVSYSAGAVVRIGINRTWTLESGIYYTRRNYTTRYDSGKISVSDKFTMVNYEIPVLGLIYIKLAKDFYLNNAFGIAMDFFPTDIQTQDNGQFYQRVAAKSWILPALMANVGAEYRTADKGYFYIGALYHRMLIPMADTRVYFDNSTPITTSFDGHYFAIDIKYFFPTKRTPVINNGV